MKSLKANCHLRAKNRSELKKQLKDHFAITIGKWMHKKNSKQKIENEFSFFLSIFLKRKSLNFFIMIAIFFWFEDSCQTDVFSMILIVVLRDVFFMDFIIIKNRKSCWWWEGWELSVQKRQESHLLSSMVGRRVENA